MSFQTPLTIKEAIENIENNKFLLPSIQREFVWEHTKIEWLFDSLMRNYPISSFLFWQVDSEVKKGYKFYKFISKYREKFKTHNSEISVDGIHFKKFNPIIKKVDANNLIPFTEDYNLKFGTTAIRYIKVLAKSYGELPPTHLGAGGKAWLFCDEIIVE